MTAPRSRVLVVGLGDTGLLTAIHLARHHRHLEVVAVGTKPTMLSGQELGLRLARPEEWSRDYRIAYERYRRLDRVRRLHGAAVALDRERRIVSVRTAAGAQVEEPYDALVISTGVSNGFWRNSDVETQAQIEDGLTQAHRRLEEAERIAVVGGGAAAVSSAYQLAQRWPHKDVALYFPRERALPGHHERVWRDVARRLRESGVRLQSGHRARVPDDAPRITTGPVHFESGPPSLPSARADAVLWAIGRVRPHTTWLPSDLLDGDGYVDVDPTLRSRADERIWAIGDVAASDPLRSSARNRADRMLARNIRRSLAATTGGREADAIAPDLRRFRPARRRWGSVLGPQADGLRVYAPDGRRFRIGRRAVDTLLRPWVIRRGIYQGIRREGAR